MDINNQEPLRPGMRDQPDTSEVSRLLAENAMLRIALEHMPHGFCMFDHCDRLLIANPRYAEIWGLPDEVMQPGTSFEAIMAATQGTETEQSRAQPGLDQGNSRVRRREWEMNDGRTIEVVVTKLADGTCIALHENITEKRKAQAQIAYLARHDPLTGLPNRRTMREELVRLLARNARGEALAVLCLDLDRFKVVNDSLGHAAGDALLNLVAERLRGCARESDFVMRLGGDEFAVFQCGAPQPASSKALAERLIAAISDPFDLDGRIVHIGTSVGIALAPEDGSNPDTLLKSADQALYRAKSEGRGLLRYFDVNDAIG